MYLPLMSTSVSGGLARPPVISLGGCAVPVRVDARAAHVPVDADADAEVVLGVILVRLGGVGRRPGEHVAGLTVSPAGPVSRHADVAAVAAAGDRLLERSAARAGNGPAVGAVGESASRGGRGRGRRGKGKRADGGYRGE